MDRRHSLKRLLLGVLILLIGGGLLIKNLGFVSDETVRYFLRWELILIIVGIGGLMHREKKGMGVLAFIVGSIFYLKYLGSQGVIPNYFEHFNFWQILFPTILILAGIIIIFKRSFECRADVKGITGEDHIDEVAIFGGGDKIINSQNFQGGKVTAIFGGSNFNLARAKMAEGKNYIDVFAVFGGMKLIVPEDWDIKIKVVSVFGGFSDKHRIQNIDMKDDNRSVLILKGFVLFGGGEIRSF